MARRNNKWARGASRPLPTHGAAFFGAQVQEGPSWDFGQEYLVRRISSDRAQKFYVCPGCNQDIPPGIAHIVAWPRDGLRGAEDRRHWHNACWQRR
ncbi:hypothetical protein [Corynebacterium aquilae]|uniref:ATP/GTP-binding protein n=1 Tax=Corynebacterium aquilae DSM 44791 TaxID=1431546 RepID=A0A1L7CFG3_9CORY|nr:ATP/GTP-binding protein [Corynebacterium aquilae DSM 44791]